MWFKNLRVYQFTEDFTFSSEEVEERLAEYRFTPCGNHDTSRYGWAEPLGRHGELLTHTSNGYIMICARKQEKILPASVINELTEEKILEIEAEQGREVFRKERRDIRDEILFSVLPKALARTQRTYAFITPKERLLIVDSASANQAEALLSHLRESIGSLQVIPLAPKRPPVDTMTNWLQTKRIGNNFELGTDCDLRDPLEAKNIVRCRQQDLSSQEILGHLTAGKQTTKLGISWNGRISGTLCEDFSVRQLVFEDILQQQAEQDDEADVATQFDNDFTIMSMELMQFISALGKVCGISTSH